MVIHFTASRDSVTNNLANLRRIIKAIHQSGQVLARDWMEPYYQLGQKGRPDISSEEIYKLNIDAINRADVLIVEASVRSFGSGFQVATALNRKKPVLILIEKSKMKRSSSLLLGIDDPLVSVEEYDLSNLEEIVAKFVERNTVSGKDLRFNFVIDRQLYNHIRWKSFKNRKTKAEVVRELLIQDMEND